MSICQKGAVESLRGGLHSIKAIDGASISRLASATVAMTTPTEEGFIIKGDIVS
jgi:hypothetical protein